MPLEVHEIYPSVLVSGGTTVTINQLDTIDPQPGIEVLEAMMAGSLDPAFIATAFAEPKVNLGCRDVQTVLTGVGLMTGFAVTTSAKFQYQARENKSGFKSGSSHVNLSSTGGLIYVADFSAKQDDKEGAVINTVYCPIWDGSTLPLVVNTAQALTGTPAANAVHALGPVNFEGIVGGLLGVQSVSVKTGIEVKFIRAGGALYAADVYIIKRKPIFEIECYNVGLLSTLTLGATYPITTGCEVHLQKCTAGGTRVAYGTTGHIKCAATAGAYKVDSLSGSKQDTPKVKITVMPTSNAVTLTAASTIVLAS